MLADHESQWDERALAQIHKLDSVFRESQRLNSVLTIGPLRIVNAKKGVTTPSGVYVPEGYQVIIPVFDNHIKPISGTLMPRNSNPSDSPRTFWTRERPCPASKTCLGGR